MKQEHMIPHSRPWLGRKEQEAVRQVLADGMLVEGKRRSEFRSALDLATTGSCALFSSGRQALHAALACLDLLPGSEVVVQTYVCDAVVWAIRAAGLNPRFCDIGNAWVAEPNQVAAVLHKGCKALILAPPFGFAQQADAFRQFGIPVINDLAQASPLMLSAMSASDLGEIATLSFHPTKYMCASGAGATVTRDEIYARKLQEFEAAWECAAHVTEIDAAVGLVQLSRLSEFEERRRQLFELYVHHAPPNTLTTLENASQQRRGTWLRFPLMVQGGVPEYFTKFASQGIIVRHGVDQLAHRNERLSDIDFPNACRAITTTLSVPFYPALSDSGAAKIAQAMATLR